MAVAEANHQAEVIGVADIGHLQQAEIAGAVMSQAV
jgi:hypothetical protein